MRIQMDSMSPSSFRLFDDDGNELTKGTSVKAVNIYLRPNECYAELHVSFPALDIQIPNKNVRLRKVRLTE